MIPVSARQGRISILESTTLDLFDESDSGSDVEEEEQQIQEYNKKQMGVLLKHDLALSNQNRELIMKLEEVTQQLEQMKQVANMYFHEVCESYKREEYLLYQQQQFIQEQDKLVEMIQSKNLK